MTAPRRLIGELLGTALLPASVVGSGIMGERLSGGNAAIALLANTLATGATLVTLLFTFGAVSGAKEDTWPGFVGEISLGRLSDTSGIPWSKVDSTSINHLNCRWYKVWKPLS